MIFTSEELERLLDVEPGHIERRVGQKVRIVTLEGLREIHKDYVDARIREIQIRSRLRNAVQVGAQNFLHYLNYRLFK